MQFPACCTFFWLIPEVLEKLFLSVFDSLIIVLVEVHFFEVSYSATFDDVALYV